MMRRHLTISPDTEPLWVRLYVRPNADHSAAMLVGDDVPPPEPGTATGLTFFGATPEEAEREAKAYLGAGIKVTGVCTECAFVSMPRLRREHASCSAFPLTVTSEGPDTLRESERHAIFGSASGTGLDVLGRVPAQLAARPALGSPRSPHTHLP
jgi:hypothetical protein